MAFTGLPQQITDAAYLTTLIRTLDPKRKFAWRNFANVEHILGDEWVSENHTRQEVRAGLVDPGAPVPKGLEGYVSDRRGSMVKAGISLDLLPKRMIEWEKAGAFASNLSDWMQYEFLYAMESVLEYMVMNAVWGNTVSLDGGRTETITAIGSSANGAVTWPTIASSTPIVDIQVGLDWVADNNDGEKASQIIMSTAQWRLLKQSTSVKEQVHGVASTTYPVSDAQARALLVGTHEFPPIELYDATIRTVNAAGTGYTSARVTPVDELMILPPLSIFPNGTHRVIFGETPDQIMYKRKGLIPEAMKGGYFAASEMKENPALLSMRTEMLLGMDAQGTSKSYKLDTTF